MTTRPRLEARSALVAAFLAQVDHAVVHEIPGAIAGTVIDPARGELTLVITPTFCRATPQEQEEFLRHEAGHLVFSHSQRCGDRNPHVFNLAADACLYHLGIEDLTLTKEKYPARTFEDWGIPACPAEIAYEKLLRQIPTITVMVAGCGRDQIPGVIGSEALSAEAQQAFATLGVALATAHLLEGHTAGPRRPSCRPPLSGTLPEPPAWASELIGLFVHQMERDRQRGWGRESRVAPGFLPGYPRRPMLPTGLVMVDASGSIPEAIARVFFAAVCSTPELAGCTGRIFSDHLSEAIPLSEPDRFMATFRAHGGGTLINKMAIEIKDEENVVWLTDAQSFDGLPEVREGWWWVITPECHIVSDPRG